ncbi:MAG: hypothetical protein V4553_16150 [Bacteroidota bacterium]
MLFIDKYIEKESLDLCSKYKNQKKVYLDLKYWILLRDENKLSNDLDRKLTTKLNELLATNKCIFPISEITFIEIMKQGDKDRRNQMLSVVDRFSRGLGITNEEDRVKKEFRYWLQSKQSITTIKPVSQLIWGNNCLITGYHGYCVMGKNLSQNLQKDFYDFVSSLSLHNICANPTPTFEPFRGKDDVIALNKGKEDFKHENNTFDEMFLSELGGLLDCYKPTFDRVSFELSEIDQEKKGEHIQNQNITIEPWAGLIYQCFKLNKIANELPFFRIFPTLFSLMRWNKGRKYKDGNDTLDVKHATCALPYCDYFFTENELKSMITQSQLDKAFDCIVESTPERILDELNKIV